jgi:hypothetical protein
MNDPSRILQRLAAAARQHDATPHDELPPGLATRVLARLRDRPAPSIWEKSALAALPVAALVALVCVLLGSPAAAPTDEADLLSGLILQSELSTAPEP